MLTVEKLMILISTDLNTLKSLKKMQKEATDLTHQHEKALQKAHKIAEKHLGDKLLKSPHPSFSEDEVERRNHEQLAYFHQHILPQTHPELHQQIRTLDEQARKARLAFKRASRNA